MSFEYLDKESEALLKELLGYSSVNNHQETGSAIAYLVDSGYILAVQARAFSEKMPIFILRSITQKGKTYFEMKERYEKEKKQLKRRDWYLLIVGALLGQLSWIVPLIIQRLN